MILDWLDIAPQLHSQKHDLFFAGGGIRVGSGESALSRWRLATFRIGPLCSFEAVSIVLRWKVILCKPGRISLGKGRHGPGGWLEFEVGDCVILGRGSEVHSAPYGADGILGRGPRISLRFIRGYSRALPPGGARGFVVSHT